MKKRVAIVRGKFLNQYEMQFFEPLTGDFSLTGFGSRTSYHDTFGFPVIKLPSPMDLPDFPYKMPVLNRLFIDAQYLLGLEKKLRGYDLVHTAETYFHYTQQCLNAKKRGYVKKVIATVLENIPHNNEGIWGRKAFKKRSRDELDHIIALTQKTKEALLIEGCSEKKITIISHFVDTSRFTPKKISSDSKTITLLFVGRLEEYKGVFDTLTVFRQLCSDKDLLRFDLRLMFVGEGSQIDTLRFREDQYGLKGKVTHQSVSYEHIPRVYQNADIFIAPSKPTTTWEEQYCTVLLEAQAAGLPIVTTNTGGIPENIGDAGVVVEPGDTIAMAAIVKKFIINKQFREDYKKRARNRALHVHDVSIGAKKLKEVYEQVLQQ